MTTLSYSDKKTELLYKTEMCRNWQEIGQCRYGKKCCFAHGIKDMKLVMRHSKYKTQICRTYHLTGTCSYGVRCTFIHQDPQPHIPVLSESSSSSTTSASSTSSSPTPAPTSPTAYYHTLTSATEDYTAQSKMSPVFTSNSTSSSSITVPISTSTPSSSSSSWLVTTNPGFSSIWLANNGGNNSDTNDEKEFWQAGLHLSSRNIW